MKAKSNEHSARASVTVERQQARVKGRERILSPPEKARHDPHMGSDHD
jgi:hypothetical protein